LEIPQMLWVRPMNEVPTAQIVSMLMVQVPVVLVCLAGFVLTLANQKRIGKAFPFALLGFGLLAVIYLVFPFLNGFLPSIIRGGSYSSMRTVMWFAGFFQALGHAVGLAFLGAAIFAGRETKTGG